jgi:drug/metabolite transporter (DMT)-like permease
MASRRAGVAVTAFGMQVLGVIAIALVTGALGRWPVFSWTQVPWAVALAFVGTLSLVALYRAFALGPIAIVSPIVASYAALSVVGIVVFLGERLVLGQVAAIAAVFIGVAIASTDLRELRSALGRPVEGVRIGLVATLGFGIWGVLVAAATRSADLFALIIVWRLVGIALVAAYLLYRRTRLSPLAVPATLATVALVGVLDTGANVLLMLGIESGFASFVMVGSGAYPIIPAVLAILVLRERLAPNQYVGVAVLIAGLVGLGLQG